MELSTLAVLADSRHLTSTSTICLTEAITPNDDEEYQNAIPGPLLRILPHQHPGRGRPRPRAGCQDTGAPRGRVRHPLCNTWLD